MQYVEAPEVYGGDGRSIFLAGGITGCPDWQQDMVHLLASTELVLLNPRRKEFPIHDPTAAPAQIRWEFDHLRKADEILFWFPCETLCPIVLYELGAWSMTDKGIYVGVHPSYTRRLDVELQTGMARPNVQIVYSVEAMAKQIRDALIWTTL